MQNPVTYNLLMFWYQNDWGVLGRRNEMLARALARHPRVEQVLHVEPPLNVVGLLRRLIWGIRSAEPGMLQMFVKTLQRLFLHRIEEGGKLKLITPFAPVPQREFSEGAAFRWNWAWYSRGLRRRFLSGAQGRPVLWLYPPHPVADCLAEAFADVPVVLDCVEMVTEDFGLAAEKRERRLLSYERLRQRASVIFVVSEALIRSFGGSNGRLVHLPNAVAPALLARSNRFAPHNLESLTVGYVGTIYDRLDLELIRALATRRPGWRFRFVGGIRNNFRRAWSKFQAACPNVERLPMCSYFCLPDIVASFDVCVIPHGISNLTSSMDPQKLYVYLAAGKPVVSTPVAISRDLQPYVALARDSDTFIRQIETLAANDSPEMLRRRREAVREQTWDRRADFVIRVLDANLGVDS